MASVFNITTASSTVQLDARGHGEIAFTVSNTSGRHLRGRAKLVPHDPGQRDWLMVAGEPERDFPVNGAQQVTVQVAVPVGSKEGRYTFRLDGVSVQNPDEDYTQGPTVAFAVAEQEVPRRFPWWIAALAVGVLLIGGLTVWLLERGKTSTLSASPAAAPTSTASTSLNAAAAASSPSPTVSSVVVPNVIGESLQAAVSTLAAANLKLGAVSGCSSYSTACLSIPGVSPPAPVVSGQNPNQGSVVTAGSTVNLVFPAPNHW